MASYVHARVVRVLAERRGLQKLEVERADQGSGNRAYALTQLVGHISAGDEVVVNTTAVDLDLGTGGWHFVHWNLAHSGLKLPSDGHQIKLRYTSMQFDTATAEEGNFKTPESLDGTPVICCELLSQAAIAAIAYKRAQPHKKLVLVMTDDNALALAFSDLIADLVDRRIVSSTITAGQAFGGDYEAVTTLSALAVAKAKANADAIIVTQGPGSLGTGSKFGFSVLGIAAVLDDVAWYGGKPILALRWSEADERERHKGLSHHSLTILNRAHEAIVPVPKGCAGVQVKNHPCVEVEIPDPQLLLEEAGVRVTTMGRGVDDDPLFFAYAAASGIAAAQGQ